MKKLILKMNVSLDGFVSGPNGEIDWIFRNHDKSGSKEWLAESLRGAGVHIMGSRTYADMAAYWPFSTDVLAAPMNEIPKVVFSRTGKWATTKALEDASRAAPASNTGASSWGQPRVASGELADEVARLKREPGKDIMAHGGAGFARSLVASGLIDEYQLVVHPVALGRGLALFADLPRTLPLTFVASRRFEGGVVAQVLRPV
jgi:dihydrofolate reductase